MSVVLLWISNNVGALKKAFLELMSNAKLREKLCMNARERARMDFDPRSAARAFLQAMEAAL